MLLWPIWCKDSKSTSWARICIIWWPASEPLSNHWPFLPQPRPWPQPVPPTNRDGGPSRTLRTAAEAVLIGLIFLIQASLFRWLISALTVVRPILHQHTVATYINTCFWSHFTTSFSRLRVWLRVWSHNQKEGVNFANPLFHILPTSQLSIQDNSYIS
jgi:hypothetical protein